MQRKIFFVIALISLFFILPLLFPLHTSLVASTPNVLAADNLPLEQFAIYGDEEVELDEIADSIGIVGSNDEIEIDDGTSGVLRGDLRALDEIENDGKIKIDGDLITNKTVDNDGELEVTGSIVEHADLFPVDLPRVSFSADGPSYHVPKYGSLTLEPGSYGRVKVRKYASLNLSAGIYFFRELDTDPHVVVVIDLKTRPPVSG